MNWKLKGFYFLSGLFTFVFSSCKHDADVATNPEISFGIHVKPVISANCTQSGCHGQINFEKFQLLSYDDIIKNGEVEGNDAVDTKLYQALVGKRSELMPPSPYDPLTDVQIKTILLWLKQGAKNN